MKEHLFEVGPGLLKNKAILASASPGSSEGAEAASENPGSSSSANHKPLIGGVITEEAIWSCTTCRACQEVCPVSNEHIDKIVDMRRYLQMVATTEVARDPLKRNEGQRQSMARHYVCRTDWAEDLDVKNVVG